MTRDHQHYFAQKFSDDFRELFTKKVREDETFGVELWSALANVRWYHQDDPSHEDQGYSFRGAGALIASMLCHGDYMDWYCSGSDGVVSEYISKAMANRGWSYELEDYLLRNE
jgi:hypothetical protein